jgi:hypothetical protein
MGVTTAEAAPHARTLWIPGGLRATPGQYRLVAACVAIAAVGLGVVALAATENRLNASRSVTSSATPRLAAAADAYVKLVRADATVSSAFLRGSVEPAALRARADSDLQNAAAGLARLSTTSGLSAQSRTALEEIARQLPEYRGLIEAARANNLQGLPVGAAYLRSASLLMRDPIIPDTTIVYEDAARQEDREYRRGSSPSAIVFVVLFGIIAFALVLGALAFTAWRSHRTVNIGLVAAAILVVVVGVVAVMTLDTRDRELTRSRRDGADALQFLAASRMLTLRSFSDENLELIERGAVSGYLDDFARVESAVAGPSGLLQQARRLAARFGTTDEVDILIRDFGKYAAAHSSVLDANVHEFNYAKAVARAIGPEAAALTRLDTEYQRAIEASLRRLDSRAADSRRRLAPIGGALLLLGVLAGACAVVGIRSRVKEYE